MADKKIGSLVVLENNKVVGILHERDISRVAITQEMDVNTTTVESIMIKKIPVVSPDTEILIALAIISEKRVRHLPVVQEGELLGLISIGDITKWLLDAQQQDIHDLISYIQGDFNVFVNTARH